MNGVRRGAWVALKYVTTLFFVGVIVQFFLVGYGLFAMKHGATIDDAKSLDAHRGLGWILAEPGAILILLLALIAWPPAKLLVRYIALAVLAFLQGILAAVGVDHWGLGMLHPVNALILLGLSGHLALNAWKNPRDPEETPAATVAT
jgi:hypothetical protein